MGNNSTQISFTPDEDGYLSQECPECVKTFKVKFSQESDGKTLSFCPYCGYEGKSCWWTTDQVNYINSTAKNEFVNPLLRDFQKEMQSLNRPGGSIKYTPGRIDDSAIVAPVETNEPMPIFNFACCDESIKYAEGTTELHCIICGMQAAVA
jgi:predicted RNA-binding Zn-ribbon protein involved in translation (DUF1610 family)